MPKPNNRNQSTSHRAAAISKIQIGKKQLIESGTLLDDADYRKLLKEFGGSDSSTKLGSIGLDAVIRRMVELGAVFTTPKRAGKKPHTLTTPANADERLPQIEKIQALLTDMHLPWGYLTDRQAGKNNGKSISMLERLTGVQRLEWCTPNDLGKVIAALAIHQKKLLKKRG